MRSDSVGTQNALKRRAKRWISAFRNERRVRKEMSMCSDSVGTHTLDRLHSAGRVPISSKKRSR
jgi:hypothetical protein